MKNLNLRFVYNSLTDQEKIDIINLWLSCGVVSQKEAMTRVNQVSIMISDGEEVVGVSTVYPAYLSTDNLYFFFRMFIKQEYRGSNLIRKQVMQINFNELKKGFDDRVKGIAVELENQKLAHLGEKTDYMQKRGYTYFGTSARGLQLWYVDFNNPKGIFND